MKKCFLSLCLVMVTSFVFAQQKKTASDTAEISAKQHYVRLNGTAYNIEALSQALKSSIVVEDNQYWDRLYQFIMGAKNGGYSAEDVNNLVRPFLPYVAQYRKPKK